MQKFITIVLALALVAVAGQATFAGSCGGGDHTHAEKTSATKASAEMNIVETAVSAGSFTTLVEAVKAAGLVNVLSGKGPFTVFAPTDEAFAKLPKGTVESLLKDKDKLTAILTYHVVSDAVPASKVVELESAKTVNGQSVSIAMKDGGVMVDKANVVKTDIMCSNGIIHVIDNVILPGDDQ